MLFQCKYKINNLFIENIFATNWEKTTTITTARYCGANELSKSGIRGDFVDDLPGVDILHLS